MLPALLIVGAGEPRPDSWSVQACEGYDHRLVSISPLTLSPRPETPAQTSRQLDPGSGFISR